MLKPRWENCRNLKLKASTHMCTHKRGMYRSFFLNVVFQTVHVTAHILALAPSIVRVILVEHQFSQMHFWSCRLFTWLGKANFALEKLKRMQAEAMKPLFTPTNPRVYEDRNEQDHDPHAKKEATTAKRLTASKFWKRAFANLSTQLPVTSIRCKMSHEF